MEVGVFNTRVGVSKGELCSLSKPVVLQTLLDTGRSLACLLTMAGSLLSDANLLPKLTVTDERFPMDKLLEVKRPDTENVDGNDSDNDDEDDDEDAAGEDQDNEEDPEEEFSGVGGEEEADPEDDPVFNGNGGSDNDEDDDDDEDEGDDEDDGDEEDDEDKEEDEEEEEDEQPPAKKKK